MSKILVADDNKDNLYFLETLLKGHGHEVVLAGNGGEALAKARSDRPDLILTDILMPVMDGFELCRQWRRDEHLAGIPFIFYTATYTDPKDEALGLRLGADKYLIKPVEPDEIIKAVEESLKSKAAGRGPVVGDRENASNYFEQYSETLYRKLQAKLDQLEQAHQQLRQEVFERELAEVQLRRLYAAIENTAECIVISDPHGRIEYVNPGFQHATGFLKTEIVGHNVFAFAGAEHDCEFFEVLRKTVTSGKPRVGAFINTRQDGLPVEFETTISPISGTNGKITGFVSVMRDMSVQKGLEAQLAQAQKMESIGTLAGGIAHDFNNILSGIMGFTELAMMKTPGENTVQGYLKGIFDACDRAKYLVKQILTFSRKAEKQTAPLDLHPLLAEIVRLLRATLPATITLTMRCESSPGILIVGDPVQIHQVIMNLATNAIHAMGNAGGRLDFVLRKVHLGEDVEPRYLGLAEGEYLQLSISDTGCGMGKATIAKIFEPFFTTKELGEGTGLGLSVAHGIVHSHGGTIHVSSEPGQGSTFNIFLPVAEGACTEQSDGTVTSMRHGTERILFIDDEKILVDVWREILTRYGYRVVALTSSPKALELFAKDPHAIDLAIIDQSMPHMTGTELTAEMLKIRPDLPIILCTGSSILLREDLAASIGVWRVLAKPLLRGDVARAIRSILGGC